MLSRLNFTPTFTALPDTMWPLNLLAVLLSLAASAVAASDSGDCEVLGKPSRAAGLLQLKDGDDKAQKTTVSTSDASHHGGSGDPTDTEEDDLEDTKADAGVAHQRNEGKSSEGLVQKDGKVEEGTEMEEDSEISGCRRRRRRRRRSVQTLDKECWYHIFSDSAFEGGWMNYEMGDGLCDDLTTYNSGYYDNMISSGLAGVSPGCKLTVYDSAACSGSNSWDIVDGTSSPTAVTKSYNQFDSWNWSDKITSWKCTCFIALLQEDQDVFHATANASHHGGSGDPTDTEEDDLEDTKADAGVAHQRNEGKSSEGLVQKDGKVEEGTEMEEDSEISGCRRRRRRRRRSVQTLDKECWYHIFSDSAFEGGWMNYEMGDGLCDDLTTYSSGYYDNMISSGLAGVSPGCKLTVYDSAACSGSYSWDIVDGTSSPTAVTKSYNQLDFWNWTDKITSWKCTCHSFLLQENQDAIHATANASHHAGSGDPSDDDD